MNYFTVVSVLFFLCSMASAISNNSDGIEDPKFINVLFWNVENLFDCEDSGKSDSEKDFLPDGERHWTKGRFWNKINGIYKTIMWTSECCDGQFPDIMGFAEVENEHVCRTLVHGTLMRKIPYNVVHRDSPDRRGIDVALVYRKDRFLLESYRIIPVRGTNGTLRTRDILLVSLRSFSSGELYHFLVNHHPSKFSGSRSSGKSRMYAMEVLKGVCDSLKTSGEENIVVMGDFNDEPDSPAAKYLGSCLVNMSDSLAAGGEGTIRYAGEWSMIDMYFVSDYLSKYCSMSIISPDFLLTEDRKHSGLKPLRTFSGPLYSGGVSDHLPVLLKICTE